MTVLPCFHELDYPPDDDICPGAFAKIEKMPNGDRHFTHHDGSTSDFTRQQWKYYQAFSCTSKGPWEYRKADPKDGCDCDYDYTNDTRWLIESHFKYHHLGIG